MAMVIALLALTVLSMLGLVLMMSLNTESRLTSQNLVSATALNLAEAGVAEATSRISSGDINLGSNPRGTALIFNAAAGSVPVVGVDTTALATAQPAGAWLAYSTANKGPNVLTVSFKTDAARTVIYKYDASKNPPIQTTSGMPIYQVTSTGMSGNATRRIVTEVMQQPVITNMKGAVVCGIEINKFNGNAFACGYNHRADTPDDTGSGGRTGSGGCNENPGINHWETGSGNLTGLWSAGTISSGGASNDDGTPPEAASQTGFYAGPWEALGMTQAAFYAWIGSPVNSIPGNPNGVYYVDDNATTQDGSWSGSAGGATGSGMLYVDGDLTMNAGFNYRGLIYVEGDVKLNGHAWILGGLIVRGKTKVKINGGATVLYSSDAIAQNIAKTKGSFITLSWREL
jgi:Tfp pilus assembly protein PilX